MKPRGVAMTGATGAIFGIRLLQVLREKANEFHLVLSIWAEKTIAIENEYSVNEMQKLAKRCYPLEDLSPPISSGSFPVKGMVVIPRSMKTLAAIVQGLNSNLIIRAAEVMLKEKRRLILVPCETPLNLIHLRNLTLAQEAGAILLLSMMAFYFQQKEIEDIVTHTVGKVLDLLEVENNFFTRWRRTE
jgi:flavin prenyltransferase